MLRKSTQTPNIRPCCLVAALFCLGIFTLPAPALAHRVLVFAFAEGDTIHTESKFVGSGPVQKGQVLVQDKKTGQTLLTGTTDDQGKYSFTIPPAALAGRLDLLIVTEAAMGHQGEWLLKAESYLSGAEKAATGAAPGASTSAASAPTAPLPPASGAKAAGFDQQALEVALNKALASQLAPLKEMLTDLTVHRTSLTDVIGGIGYILGIFGLLAYFMSKKQPKP